MRKWGNPITDPIGPVAGGWAKARRDARAERQAERRAQVARVTRETGRGIALVAAGAVLVLAGYGFGRTEEARVLTEQGRVLPACAVGAGVAEDEVRYDFVGGRGATLVCLAPDEH